MSYCRGCQRKPADCSCSLLARARRTLTTPVDHDRDDPTEIAHYEADEVFDHIYSKWRPRREDEPPQCQRVWVLNNVGLHQCQREPHAGGGCRVGPKIRDLGGVELRQWQLLAPGRADGPRGLVYHDAPVLRGTLDRRATWYSDGD